MKISILDNGVLSNVIEAATVAAAQALYPSATVRAYAASDEALRSVVAAAVPASVTMRQARLALRAAGKLALVDAAIASLPEPQKTDAQITWEFSGEVQRANGLVSQLAPALGMTEAQIDALFIAAAGL